MLSEIRVKNFAIINQLSLEFGKGLNIVTGETGSGKSLLIKSLSLLMGEKGNTELIKHGSPFAQVEGLFNIENRPDILEKLKELNISHEEGEELIIRRVISEDKPKVYINDQLVTLQTLKNITFPLIDLTSQSYPLIEITGQHDNKNLLNRTFHLEILDQFAGLVNAKLIYFELFKKWQDLQKKIEELKNSTGQMAQKLDFLTFQKKEIEEVNPKINEDLELEEKTKAIKNQAKISAFYKTAQDLLSQNDDSILSALNLLLKKQPEVSGFHDGLKSWFTQLEGTYHQINDLSYQIESFHEKSVFSEDQVEELHNRFNLIRKLQKKYGPQITDVLKHYEKVLSELSLIENQDGIILKLEIQAQDLFKQLTGLAQDLHSKRKQSAQVLIKKMNEQLTDLNMKGVKFHIHIEQLNQLHSTGHSLIEFHSQTRSDAPSLPLSKSASGGELSRILLSLKVVTGADQFSRTYLFDEVDTGVSGPTAEKVGNKLFQISKDQQVICVTHLPQVAAFADHHLVIEKSTDGREGNNNIVQSFKLSKADRAKELAKLLSGQSITQTSLKHAQELLKSAQNLKDKSVTNKSLNS